VTTQTTAHIHGRESFLLEASDVELAVTRIGGMLGPVTFFPGQAEPIRPYAIAPWVEETLPPDTPPMIAGLRGDWFCSAFGENSETHSNRHLPPHGETANLSWSEVARGGSATGSWMTLGIDLPEQGGRCEATTSLLNQHSIVYQRHVFTGLTGPINPGHHATLAFPDVEGAGRLSFSRFVGAWTYVQPTERPENRGYSWLKPDVRIYDLHSVPCIDGSTTDLCRYPARRGYEDIAIVCTDPALSVAWSAVTSPEQGFVWFALRDPKQLASTVLWFSNGGRHFAPWNGRHINVLGVEDVTAFFHAGLAASCRPNQLNSLGIPTVLQPNADGQLGINYIQGVARIPPGFDSLMSLEPQPGLDRITLVAESGVRTTVACQWKFLETGAVS
jgi:hypothetical protein